MAGLPLTGSCAFASVIGAGGFLFGALAAVTAQVSAGAAGARGWALGVLAGFFTIAGR